MKERTGVGVAGRVALISACIIGLSGAKVVLYPGAPGMTPAPDRQVTVDGQAVFVYEAPVNFNRAYTLTPILQKTPVAYFDFSGPVNVIVTAPGEAITTAVLRPASCGVQPIIAGDKMSFTLTKPCHLTLEVNNLPNRALHLFADSIEANPAKNGDANVRYFGPGVHDAGEMNLGTGQTIYIAGGAVVYGAIRGGSINNATVRGRGILHGGKIARDRGWQNLINIHSNSSNIRVNGIILFDSPTWNMNIRQTSGMQVSDVKIIGARPNSDGIDFVGCQNSTVDRCFVRAWDDCLCVKTDNTGNSSGIHFSNCVIWTDLAQSMEVGYETRSDLISDISFKNIDVIHAYHKPVMSIHAGDRATVDNIRWEDIRVEDARLNNVQEDNLLVDLWIGTAVWTQDAQRGKISNVSFKNISMTGGRAIRNRITGFDAGHRITGVTIENMTILGKPIRTLADGGFITNAFMDEPKFTYSVGIIQRWTGGRNAEGAVVPMRAGSDGTVRFLQPGRSGKAFNVAGQTALLRGKVGATYRN